jgi:hypothetical protein
MSEAPTFYEQFGPLERRWKKLYDWARALFINDPVYLIEINWRLGDEIMAIPIYEALHKDLEKVGHLPEIHVWANYPDLLVDNPFIKSVNDRTVKPDKYMLLRGVSQCVSRQEFYIDKFAIQSGLSQPKLHYSNWAHPISDRLKSDSSKTIALCPGASWDTKRWEKENWKKLGKNLAEEGYQVIELGNTGEAIGAGLDFTGKTSVKEAAHLVHEADLVISHDSGLMHLSLAAGTPTVGLFGPTNPSILIQDNDLLAVVGNERECAGCWNRPDDMVHPGVCPLHIPDCMKSISVETVLESARSWLQKDVA